MKYSLLPILFLSFFLFSSAHAAETKPLLFTVAETSDPWGSSFCDGLLETFTAPCLRLDLDSTEHSLRLSESRHSGDFRYHIQIDRPEPHQLSLTVTDWDINSPGYVVLERSSDLSDHYTGASWTIHTLEQNTLGRNALEPDYAGRPPYRLRTTLLLAKSMAWATWWYHASSDINTRDWDFTGLHSDEPDLRPQADKWRNFGGWRFDDNVLFFNSPLHPMAGAGFHILARSNHFGIWKSILAANLTSLFWEAVIEHHEVMSVNDLIFTGIAGIPLGEAYMQLGHFFRRAQPTPLNQALSWLFSAPMQFNDLLDGTGPIYYGDRGDLGWPTDIYSSFLLESSFGLATGPRDTPRYDAELRLDTELVRLPRYRQPTTERHFLTGPLSTELGARIAAGNRGFYGWHLTGYLDFLGWYRQDLSDDLHPQGYSAFAGLGMGFRHIEHDFDRRDRHGLLHLPGLSLITSYLTGPLDLRLRYRLTPDFSHFDSFALDDYRQTSGLDPNRSVLDDWGYYYGYGFSQALHLHADLAAFRLHYSFDHHWTRSIDALDRYSHDTERFGPNLDDYLSLTDRLLHHQISLSLAIPNTALRLGLKAELRDRSGSISHDSLSIDTAARELRALTVLQLTP